MAYGEQCPTDSATKKFEGVLTDNGAAANEFVAKAGANYRTQNAEIVADQVVQLTATGGAGATIGATTDAAVVTDAAGTLSGKLRGLVKWAFERMPASLGQKAKAASLPVTLSSDEDVLGVSVADGSNAAIGATTDAAVVTDAAGTLSGKLRGLVKWAFERMPASLGQKAMAASLPVVIASDQSALPIALTTDFDSVSFELNGDNFDAGDVVEGLQSMALAGGTRIKAIVVSETHAAAIKANLDVLVFDSNPTSSVFTNNAAPNIDVGDILKICGCVKVATADYETFLTPTGLAVAHKDVDIPVTLGTTLYAVLVLRDAASYASSPCLRVRLLIEQ